LLYAIVLTFSSTLFMYVFQKVFANSQFVG
jgi:hypothetical protein